MSAPSVESIQLMDLMMQVHMKIANTTHVRDNLKYEIKCALNTALRELVRRTSNYGFRKAGVIDITAADVAVQRRTFALPYDFSQELEEGVKLRNGPRHTLRHISDQDWDARGIDSDDSTGEPCLYMIRGRNAETGAAEISFAPIPAYVRTISLNYVSFPSAIYRADDSSYLDKRIPPDWHDMLPTGALRHMPNYCGAHWEKYMALWEGFVRQAHLLSMPVVGQNYQREMYSSTPIMGGFGRVPETLVGPDL